MNLYLHSAFHILHGELHCIIDRCVGSYLVVGSKPVIFQMLNSVVSRKVLRENGRVCLGRKDKM